MPILNYTTEVAAEKTVSQITSLLVKHGALSARVEYSNKQPVAIVFETQTQSMGTRHYIFTTNVEGVLEVMKKDKAIRPHLCKPEQALRVAWRIEKDWLEAQFAKIEATQTPLEQLMMPYMQTDHEQSLYQVLVQQHRALMARNDEGEK